MKSIHLLKTEKGRQSKENGGGVVRDNTLRGGQFFFPVLKVPRQWPLAFLVEVRLKVVKALGCGHCYE
jgi:hypothetical protein